MASKYVKFIGIATWAFLTQPDKLYNNYKITLELDEAGLAALKASGLQLRPKDNKVTFRRPASKLIKDEVVNFGPPKVTKDREPFLDIVGNGSLVSVDIVVYDTIKGKGHRLQEVKVLNLVPYVKKEDLEELRPDDEPFKPLS